MLLNNFKVLHIITSLNSGGAEGVLYRICKNDKAVKHVVISLTDGGVYGPKLTSLGVNVYNLNMVFGSISLFPIYKLYSIITKEQPDVVQTWMYHSDFIGGFIAKLCCVRNLFWNVRHSSLEPNECKRSTRYIAKINSYLSRFIPKNIIYCAIKARHVHETIGYDKNKSLLIQNGYEIDIYKDSLDYSYILEGYNISNATILFGMVARFDPLKDHENLLSSLNIVKQKFNDFKLLLIGEGVDSNNIILMNTIINLGLSDNVILLGRRSDIPNIMNLIDIHILSSSGEAFPNVIAEAMACGTPNITTDVGDAALLVGDTGWVVQPKDALALADAIMLASNEFLTEHSKWQLRAHASRKRIIDNFTINRMIDRYHKVWFTN